MTASTRIASRRFTGIAREFSPEKTLGFTCDRRRDKWGWASLHRDGAELMLATPNSHDEATSAAFTGSLYFRTDGVDALWNAWKEAARICYPPENFDYGMREFAIYDNNGYLLQFGQPLLNQL